MLPQRGAVPHELHGTHDDIATNVTTLGDAATACHCHWAVGNATRKQKKKQGGKGAVGQLTP